MVWIFFDVENQITRRAKRDTSNERLRRFAKRAMFSTARKHESVIAKGKAKLARVVAIQKIALKFSGRNGRWGRLNDGSEVMKYEDAAWRCFTCATGWPVESRRQFNLGQLSIGLITFRRGDWEEVFLPPPQG